jgi:hypothetical protein
MQKLPSYFTTPNKMTSKNDIKGLVSLKFLRPWDMAMRPIFRSFCINQFGIGLLHYILSRSGFGFEKRLADSEHSSWNNYSSVAKNRDTLRKEDTVNRDIFRGRQLLVYLLQDPEMKFWEAAAVRAALKHGGADSVFVHSINQEISGRQGRLCFFRKLHLNGLCHEIEFNFFD